MKDHYKTLGVSPSAAQQEIKKAYRALAFKYHPDKNPEDSLAEAFFKELQEAYATLSVPAKRAKYDDDRWLMGMDKRQQQAVTPEWLVNICRQLNQSLAAMDTYRLSHGALREYILLILTDAHMGVLLQRGDHELIRTVVRELLTASGKLDHEYLPPVTDRLLVLAKDDNDLMTEIYSYAEQREKKTRIERLRPYIILLITLLLCLFMYLYGGWK